MPLLTATNVELNYGTRRVLDRVSLSVEAGERIGVVGRNGGGKSTLLRVLAGDLKPDAGHVSLAAGHRLGYLRQEPNLPQGETLRGAVEAAFDELHALHLRLEDVFARMAGATGEALDRLLKEQQRLETRVDAAGGYAIDHRIDQTLHGLGFTDEQFAVPVEGLSGGQRSRAALARLLLEEPSVLLLDEPTNHLDIAGRLWLEAFLRETYKGAVVLISHDRALLDNVVDRIIEVEPVPGVGGRLIDYPGNYAAFRRQRADRILTQQRAWEKQQAEFKREEAYIRKYKAGQRAKQAKGRESRLERAKADSTIERPMELATLTLSLPKAERSGEIVATARGIAKAYTNDDGSRKVLFRNLDITIERGQRWGIIGPNGAGKSTLVRCLLGETTPDEGNVITGSRLAVGYYRQTHEGLDPALTVVRFLQDAVARQAGGVRLSEQQARDLAGAFLFSGLDQEKQLGMLSGGERGRAVLASLLATGKNVLVLDEPTNHFDIPSAERLEEALRRPPTPDELALDENAGRQAGLFDGTLILISHDRALLDACCDRLLVLDGEGNAKVFLGTYARWAAAQHKATDTPRHQIAETKPVEAKAPATKTSASPSPATQAIKPATPAKKSKWSWMRVEQIEEKMASLTDELRDIDVRLADPDVWLDHEKANALTDRRDELKTELAGLEEEWLRKAD